MFPVAALRADSVDQRDAAQRTAVDGFGRSVLLRGGVDSAGEGQPGDVELVFQQVVNDLDRNPSGYSEEEGSLNDTIDMIFGNDADSDDYKYNDDDYTDSYDDED